MTQATFRISEAKRAQIQRERNERARARQEELLAVINSKSLFMEDVIAEYWEEYTERANYIAYRERANKALSERQNKEQTIYVDTVADSTCYALSAVRPDCISKFEHAVLMRERDRERARESARRDRERKTAIVLNYLDAHFPIEQTNYVTYRPHMKYVSFVRKNGTVKRVLLPVRFHVHKRFRPMRDSAYYAVQHKVVHKTITTKKTSFVFFPDTQARFSDTFMRSDEIGAFILDTARRIVTKTLLHRFALSGQTVFYTWYIEALKQAIDNSRLANNNHVETTVTVSTKYRDSLTGKYMQREHEKLIQTIVRDTAKELDKSELLTDETKVNKEEYSYLDIDELISVAVERLCVLMVNGIVTTSTDIMTQKKAVYSAINSYIDSLSYQWKMIDSIVISDSDTGEETLIDIPVFDHYTELSREEILAVVRDAVRERVTSRFDMDTAMRAYAMSKGENMTNIDIARALSCDEKQVRRWTQTIDSAIHTPETFDKLTKLFG